MQKDNEKLEKEKSMIKKVYFDKKKALEQSISELNEMFLQVYEKY